MLCLAFAQFVDAPVSGGINAASAGTLTFMVTSISCFHLSGHKFLHCYPFFLVLRWEQSLRKPLLLQRSSSRTWEPRCQIIAWCNSKLITDHPLWGRRHWGGGEDLQQPAAGDLHDWHLGGHESRH